MMGGKRNRVDDDDVASWCCLGYSSVVHGPTGRGVDGIVEGLRKMTKDLGLSVDRASQPSIR